MKNCSVRIMSSDANLNLEAFVRHFFTCQGAEIEENRGRLDVLAPRELARRIGIPTFSSLKIGEEDPDGFGVHYGSPLLEKMAEAACDTVPLTIVRLAFHYLKSQGFDRLLRDVFTILDAVINVKSTAAVQTEYLLLTCRFMAQSDEQKEGLVPLAFHLETGAPVSQIEAMLDATEKRFETGGIDAASAAENISLITQWVQRRAPKILEARIASFRESMNRRFRRDVTNLEEYYTDFKREMTKKLARPGLSPQLIQERKEKIDLIPDELTKKKDDLFKKYSINVELALSGAMLIRTPAVKLFCQATIGRRKKPLTLFYNPINKSLDPLVCEGCGDGTYQIHFCDGLHLLCSQCRPSCPVC